MYRNLPGTQPYSYDDLYTVYLPPLPEKSKIIGHDLKKSDQYWRRVPLPKYYEERREEEEYRQNLQKEQVDKGEIRRVTYFDPVLERYRRQEWERRIEGVWFMNNGKPVYLTGAHYFYLQWCKLDVDTNDGYPTFYLNQLKRFYHRQLCLEDPWSLGYIIVGSRGFGKTAEEVACQLENMTRPRHNRNAAIQSKDEEEAKAVIMQQKMVPMFNGLPHFFKPEFSHGTDTKEKMVFKRPSVKGQKSRMQKHGEDFELSNTITAFAPHNKKLDSQTLSDIINDEIGKLKPEANQDAYTRHAVNTRCVYRNHRKIGLIRATTTVEEMDQGGEECFEIWQESDPRIRDQNGYTISKIYQLFVSAIETRADIADRYGYIDPQKAYELVMNEREPLKHDNYKLALQIRKSPITAGEAFLRDQGRSTYDVMILNRRISELESMKPQNRPGRTFMLEWVGGKRDGDVELIEHPDGPVRIFYLPDERWTKHRKLLNACKSFVDEQGETQWEPVNNDLFRSSSDPIKFVKTDDGRASKMAAHGMLMYNQDIDGGKPLEEWITNNIMWEYHARHTDPEVDYENVIKLMRYFGHSIMPEFNTGEFVKHLNSRGYKKFLIVRRQFDPTVLISKFTKNSLGGEQPVHSSTEVIESYVKRTAAFIRRHGHRINSLALLKQLQSFDPKNPGKFDLAVSFGYAILSMEAELDAYFDRQKGEEEMMSYFSQYDISGNQSRLLNPSSSGSSDDEEEADYDDENFGLRLMRT